jgi:hypothetical protein
MILVVKKLTNGYYSLCQDDRFRHFANYGSFSECVKEYKLLGAARNRADIINRRSPAGAPKAEVAILPSGYSIDATSTVFTPDGKKVELSKFFHKLAPQI